MLSIISQLSEKFLSIHCKGTGYYVITCSIVCSCSYLVKTSRCHPNQRVNFQPQILVHFHLQQVHVCDFSLQTFTKDSVCHFFFTTICLFILYFWIIHVSIFTVKFCVGTPPNVSTPWRRGSIGSSQGGAQYHPPSNASNSPSRRASK